MKIVNLNKRFGKKVIFNDSFFEFEDHKITYITGESGIGKSTLLRILAGLDKDYKGEIITVSSKISYVFQDSRLFSNLTVEENVKIVSESSPYTSDQVLSLVELDDEKYALPSSLSGGMKMRVALARALYNDGDIYLMDEPFSALDDATRERILPKIFEFLKGKTIIIVSHNLIEANKYADKIVNLD